MTELELVGMVCWEVELYSRFTPLRVVPLVSFTTAVKGCELFRLMLKLEPVCPGAESVMDAGGQVEKKPAELAAPEIFAEISTDPG